MGQLLFSTPFFFLVHLRGPKGSLKFSLRTPLSGPKLAMKSQNLASPWGTWTFWSHFLPFPLGFHLWTSPLFPWFQTAGPEPEVPWLKFPLPFDLLHYFSLSILWSTIASRHYRLEKRKMRINRGTMRLVEQIRTLALHCRTNPARPFLPPPFEPLSTPSFRFYSKGSYLLSLWIMKLY